MKAILVRCVTLVLCMSSCRPTSAPSYCSYILAEGYFDCDYSKMSNPADRPLNLSDFDPTPQRLVLRVNGFLPYLGDARVFGEDFVNITISDFDTNYPASLVLDCGWYGSLNLYAGAFANMSYIQHLTIKNCYVFYIEAEVFKDFTNLDFLAFEGGAIDLLDPDAMTGVSVEQLESDSHTFPQPLGHFETRNCAFNTKYVSPGLLFNWKNLTSVSFRNSDLNTISEDTFRYTTKLHYIDLGENLFTNIPTGLFFGLDSLAEIHLDNINWVCSCESLWWYDYLNDRNVTIFGDLMCETPAGISVGKFLADNCRVVELCGDQIGIKWEDEKQCLTMFDFMRYGFGFIGFCVSVACLGIVIHAKRQMGIPPEDRQRNTSATRRKRNSVGTETFDETERKDGERRKRSGREKRKKRNDREFQSDRL